jgi:hypothetical protein
MTNLTVFDFNAQGIRFENRDGQIWACLTDMAKASGKLVADYLRLKSTNEFTCKLETIMGIPVISRQMGEEASITGTWAVEEVVLDFATWCSIDFRIWTLQQIKTLMATGKVELGEKLKFNLDIAQLILNEMRLHEQRLSAIELENMQLKAQLAALAAQSELIQVVARYLDLS